MTTQVVDTRETWFMSPEAMCMGTYKRALVNSRLVSYTKSPKIELSLSLRWLRNNETKFYSLAKFY